MNHGSALFHTTIFLLFFVKTVNSRRWYAPILAGTGLGMLINIRPYTALAVAIPVCIYALVALGNDFRRHLLRLSALALVTLCFVGILLSYNYLTNGSPTLFGYVVQFGKAHNPGFGSGPDGKPAHTPQRGLMISLKDLNFLEAISKLNTI
jgi:4-amino-4-deoxy-L-arabinose transferase-like glycosyltransferase